ncbi:MAG: IS607 family transposase [Desulfurococcales archaeon]|nr:IS607 family transposase [Desulfurococcales archaeon]
MEEFLSPRDACRMLGISYITLWRWIREGRIKVVRSPSGRYLIPRSEIERLKGEEKEVERVRAVIYARVSSNKQREQGDLDRQLELLKKYANEHGYIIVDVITDVGSGLKEERRGLKKLLKIIADRRVDVVLITYRDRLTRFGFKYLQFFFEKYGVRIEEVLHEEKEPLEELIEDFLATIVLFAGKIYGKRSRKVKKLVEHNKRFLQETLPIDIEKILKKKQ